MNDYPIVTDENGVPRAPVPPSLVTVTRVVYRQLPAFFYSLPRGSLKTATVA